MSPTKFLQLTLFTPLIFFISCSSEKEGDLQPDCSASGLSVEISSVVDANCSTPGSFTAVGSGGSGIIRYSIDGSTFTEMGTFESLVAGTYTLTIKDENECSFTEQVTIGSEDGAIALSITDQSAAGCGASEGSVSVEASDGAGDYTYSIDGGEFQESSSFTGLSAGEHTVSAKDANGCETSESVTIPHGISLASDIMPIISANCANSSNCHGSGASGARPDFSDKAVILDKADRIKLRTGDGSMPQGSTLEQTKIDMIACWVDDGAKDN